LPPKADPRDWERLFRPNAPRRGGPLRVLSNILLTVVVLGLLSGATYVALRFGLTRARESATATQVAIATNNAQVIARQTADAERSATAAVAAAAPAATSTAAPAAPIGTGSVVAGGNLRSAPELRPETVIGQICPGDQVDVLEQTTLADGQVWYRVRLSAQGQSCSAQRVTLGSLGWASATLLSEPAP